jgi:cytochrome c peroxidase
MRRVGPLLTLTACALAQCAQQPGTKAHAAADASYVWHLPRGFPTPAVPPDNPMSSVKVALGRRLFFEPRLSITGNYSCASCHDPSKAFTDGKAHAVGARGDALPHSSMSLINVAYNISFGWTKPELQSLEAQMLEPLLNEHPVELGVAGREAEVCDLLASEPSYRDAFADAFPHKVQPITFDNLIKAIASYERTLIYGNSPFDRYVFGGDHAAIPEQAKRGMKLFYSARAGCSSCHSGLNFAGNWRDAQGETGKSGFADNGVAGRAMRVPTLRNIALTAPYMHDGSLPTLDAVLDHYARVARQRSGDERLHTFDLSADERTDVIAFLETLTDPEVK